jgi:uncharacterized protein YvpB
MIAWVCILTMAAGCSAPRTHLDSKAISPGFVSFNEFSGFERSKGERVDETVLTSPVIRTRFVWDELVVSWNAIVPPGCGMRIEARALYSDHATEFYILGYWSEDTAEQPRESVNGQKDEDGEVQTDTLILKRSTDHLQLRISLFDPDERTRSRLKFVGLSLLNTKASQQTAAPSNVPGNRPLPVPERSQRVYPGGRDWCSPTSVSMVLAYWSSVLRRPDLDIAVPEVAAGVYDKNWPGTGNWPFNTAFAGRLAGMRAYVTRLADLSELETLVAAGIPPIVSVSFDLLHGRLEDQGSGHLVVCAGFTEQGDVVINDPWAALEKGEKVRQVIPRQNLAKAWQRSRQTVYLVYPETWRVPPSPRW